MTTRPAPRPVSIRNRPPAQWAGGLIVSAGHIAQLNQRYAERIAPLLLSGVDSGSDSRADSVSLAAIIEIVRSIRVGVSSGLVLGLQLAESEYNSLLSEGQVIISFPTGHARPRCWPDMA